MTHEEAAVHLVRDTIESYAQYPFMIYQIQTKFRDEPRSRGGLIRVREFTMKDGYSFHLTQQDLEDYYQRCHEAYERIFTRAGIPEVISVQSDSGMMGGKVAHEFMLVTEVGEDSLALCAECDFKSNVENAACIVQNTGLEHGTLQKIPTPGIESIDALCEFLKITPKDTCKAVMYQENLTDRIIVAFVRGDLDVNETKLRNYLKKEIHPAELADDGPLAAGYTGPIGISKDVTVVYDRSLIGLSNVATGANEKGYHYIGFSPDRDVQAIAFHDIAKTYTGAICPACGKPAIRIERGIELGNIFQLGQKYTEAMGMDYLDDAGQLHHPIMGCYGIGVERLMASICEVRRDEHGPIWPLSVAPWQVQICSLRADNDEVRETSRALYDALVGRGVEVLWDDRPVSAGVMFSDADLMGIPLRVVISPKGLAGGTVEISDRKKTMQDKVDPSRAESAIIDWLEKAREEF
ncbi:MAG: proline--tRNA ligase, partial [Clostridia bacterium]|nr:proline--tRNA ligase [Clostridia bacterium]